MQKVLRQLAVLTTEVAEVRRTVCQIEKRMLGTNGDGLIVRLRLIEQRINSRRRIERVLISGVGLLIMERIYGLLLLAPPGGVP